MRLLLVLSAGASNDAALLGDIGIITLDAALVGAGRLTCCAKAAANAGAVLSIGGFVLNALDVEIMADIGNDAGARDNGTLESGVIAGVESHRACARYMRVGLAGGVAVDLAIAKGGIANKRTAAEVSTSLTGATAAQSIWMP